MQVKAQIFRLMDGQPEEERIILSWMTPQDKQALAPEVAQCLFPAAVHRTVEALWAQYPPRVDRIK